MFEGPKFGLQEQRAGLALAEELVLEVHPGGAGGGVTKHQGLLQVVGDGAVDPSDDAAIHRLPCRASWMRGVGEDVVLEIVLAEYDVEHGSPTPIVVGRLVQCHRDQDLDVVDTDRLGVKGGVGSLLGGEFPVEGLSSLLSEARGGLLGSLRHPVG